MRGAGGRSARGLLIAVALSILVVPIPPMGEAQATSDPWYGNTDRTRPTEPFGVRIPVIVENTFDYGVADPFVAVEIDFGQALVQAGWTNQTIGAEARVRGFTLDVDSIRVIEYGRGFVTGPIAGAQTPPTPHVFYPALLETGKFREFDPARNPAGTILFQIPGSLEPNGKRYFYIHAHPLEYSDAPAPTFDPLLKGSVDAFLWGTKGNVYYGFEPQQEGQNHFVRVRAAADGQTRVTVSTYELGRFVPLPSTSSSPNPVQLSSGGSTAFFIPAGKAYKIESNRPLDVVAHGPNPNAAGHEMAGYISGRSGSFADDRFDVYGLRTDAGNLGLMTLQVYKASPGAVTITTSAGRQVTLSNALPVSSIGVPVNQWTSLVGTGQFLVSMTRAPSGGNQEPSPFAPHPVPSTTGGPLGTSFYTYLANDAGSARICANSNSTARLVDYTNGGTLQIHPEGNVPTTPPALYTPKPMCEEVLVPRTAPSSALYELYATKEERDPVPGAPVPLRLFVSAGKRQPDVYTNLTRPFVGHFSSFAGVDHYVHGSVGLFGHYNDTRITIFEEHSKPTGLVVTNRTRALQRDEFFPLQPSSPESTKRYHIVSTKPIGAVSLEGTTYSFVDRATEETITRNIPYGVYLPGRPQTLATTIGKAEFKGPLVDVRSPDAPDSRQITRGTGPGSPVTFKLDVLNLGRWVSGESLPDTITLSCTTPAGWVVDGCNRAIDLSSGSSERANVVITPSVDDVNVTRTIQVEARSKLGGPIARFNLSVFVQIKYGVGLWFDVEDGRKTIDPPVGLDPAGTYDYTIVLKNLGSTQDTFRLRVDDPVEGWTQELLSRGEPVTSVRLDGNETTLLTFRVTAPNAETARQNLVSITAESVSSATAHDVVNTASRIRPKIDLSLIVDSTTKIAAPNETAVFNITTRNKGNDVFTVIFRQDSLLPKGWNASLSVDEITLNPNPGADPALDYVLKLSITPPPGARAGDLANVKLAAEVDIGGAGGRSDADSISAVVVVQRVYNLTTPPIADAEALPGETLRFVLPVTNSGNGQVTLEQLPGAVDAVLVHSNGDETRIPGWGVTLEGGDVTLALNGTAELPLRIEVPPSAPPGLYNLTFTARLSRETLANLTVPVGVQALSRVVFEGAPGITLTPGRPATLTYVARNTGNLEATFAFAGSAPSGWNATFSPPRAHLAPGERVEVLVAINASTDARDGDQRVTLAAQSDGAPATPTELLTRVARPDLHVVDAQASGALRTGETILVSATIGNRGGMAAENVSVALVVDDRVVDRIVLSRVPVGTSALASLSWVSTQRGGAVAVVIDPDQEFSLPDRAETAKVVEFGSRIGVPGPAVGALVLLAGAVALARRREGERR